jgi:hypothetical protein
MLDERGAWRPSASAHCDLGPQIPRFSAAFSVQFGNRLRGDLAGMLTMTTKRTKTGRSRATHPFTRMVVEGARNHLYRTFMEWVRPSRSAYNQQVYSLS